MFGDGVTLEHIVTSAGAPDGATATVTAYTTSRGRPYIDVNWASSKATASRYFKIDDDGKLFQDNSCFFLNNRDSQSGKGEGVKTFNRIVTMATALGCHRIETHACRSSSMNGYYTWPRFGYNQTIADADIYDHVKRDLRSKFNARDFHQLMSTEEGRKYWQENGSSVHLSFDLSPGSTCRRVLNEYIAERSAREGRDILKSLYKAAASPVDIDLSTQDPNDIGDEPPVLDELDEQILDEIWDRIGEDLRNQ